MQEIIVDSFAGGGGASTGIEIALGRSPDVAINHDGVALAMHAVNHPATQHLPHNIWKVDPLAVCQGRPVGLLWASPDCKHFSKAKGGRPVEQHIRDLAWVVVRWARQVAPRVIILENVEEFAHWGPLTEHGMPCPERKGHTFKRWVRELRKLGYKVEHRELRACDYGAPTVRKRLFLIARRDGLPIVWPKPTHAKPGTLPVTAGKLKPWRAAAEIIDWSLTCHSIFLTPEEAKKVNVRRPLAPATMARIAKGVQRYVLDAAEPFIVPITHTGDARTYGIDEPVRTVTTAHRGEQALVTPFVSRQFGASVGSDAEAPIGTVTAGGGGKTALVTPIMIHTAHGDTNGKTTRGRGAMSIEEPSPTSLASRDCAVVAPLIVKNYHGDKPHYPVTEPTRTILTGQHHMLVAPTLINTRNGEREGQEPRTRDIEQPYATVTAKGSQGAVVAAFLAQHNTDMVGHHPDEPVSTIVQKGCTQAVVSAGLVNLKGEDRRQSAIEAPAPTQTAGGWHTAEVRAFLVKYFGTDQDPRIEEPLHTATTKHRFGLVTVHGEPYAIVDIGMRMLTPRELFLAQGFSPSYVIDRTADGKPITKTDQIRMCGNSVCPPIAAALVAANYAEIPVSDRGVPEFAMTAAE